MLEEIYEDNLIGDLNDLDEIIEQQGDALLDEAEEEETEGNANNATSDDNRNSNATRVEPKKRTVKNPRPKLDPERLKGPRGIAVIADAFKDFKFHGKGYEKMDLNRVMKRLEHWAHRLYPRFQFDDCLDKIEKLGQKKPVQVYVKKIRMGLESVDEPVVLLDDIDEPEINNEAPLDAFDELLSQQLSQVRPENQTRAPTSSQVPSLPDQSVALQSTELTAEQRERMLRNKLMAEERRLARMTARCEIQRTVEMELSTVEVVSVQPSPAISVSNNETITSTSEINTNNIEATYAEEANVPSTNVVSSAHAICENKETSVCCKEVGFEGNNTVYALVDIEEDTISKQTELGKITASQLVDADETSLSSAPVNTEQTDIAVMSVSTEEVNTISGPVVGEETNAVCILDESERTSASSMPVLGKETHVNSLPFDTEETYAPSMSMDSQEPGITSIPYDTKEMYAIAVPTDSEANDVISMSVDTEEIDTTSILVNAKDNDVTCMPVDAEYNT